VPAFSWYKRGALLRLDFWQQSAAVIDREWILAVVRRLRQSVSRWSGKPGQMRRVFTLRLLL